MKQFRRETRERFGARSSSRPRRSERGFGSRDSGSRERFGGPSFNRSGRDSPRRESSLEMHSAICAKCGKECEVPFRPSGSKPVYCSNCFKKSDNFEQRGSSASSGELDEINRKLDKILKALRID